MLFLSIFLLLQLIAQFHQNRKQFLWRMGKCKIKIIVGDSSATSNTAFLLTQIAQQQTFSTSTWSNKSQNRKQRPGLNWITPAQKVKKRNGLMPVGEGCKLIIQHMPFSPTLICAKIAI